MLRHTHGLLRIRVSTAYPQPSKWGMLFAVAAAGRHELLQLLPGTGTADVGWAGSAVFGGTPSAPLHEGVRPARALTIEAGTQELAMYAHEAMRQLIHH